MILSKLPTAIIGLGKTGISIAKYFDKNKVDYHIYDTRSNLIISEKILNQIGEKKITLGPISIESINDHDNFIVSPGISLEHNFITKIKNANKNIQTDIDLFDQEKRKNVLCITGSNGKTTVTLLLEHILNSLGKKAKAGGNIGLPALELLETNLEYNILELSSFQLEMTKKISCLASLITNITPDHLDRHKSFENYKYIKHKIFENTEKQILNRSDKNIYKNEKNITFSFGSDKPPNNSSFGIEFSKGLNYVIKGKERILCENEIKLLGRHNLENICASLAIINFLGLDINKALESIKDFNCVEHRMEKFHEKRNVHWINDSKSTNKNSTISAVNALKGNIILILGGRSKTNNYTDLEKIVNKKSIYLILYGECNHLLNKNIKTDNDKIVVKNIDDAVTEAYKVANFLLKKNKDKITILLSPACSSYDMYDSYEERGRHFKSKVIKEYR